MTLTIDQIAPGVVAWLDAGVLNADARVTACGAVGVRPFLCVTVGAGYTEWLALTTKSGVRVSRFLIQSAWRVGGTTRWREQPTYLRSLRALCRGRDVVFVDAAAGCRQPVTAGSERVSAAGMVVISAAVEQARQKRLTAETHPL